MCLQGDKCHTPFGTFGTFVTFSTEKLLHYTIQVLNKNNEWGDVYDDKHITLATRGFSIPHEVTNLLKMLAVLGLSIERSIACVRECRDATRMVRRQFHLIAQ